VFACNLETLAVAMTAMAAAAPLVAPLCFLLAAGCWGWGGWGRMAEGCSNVDGDGRYLYCKDMSHE